jgi:hypothetical protein
LGIGRDQSDTAGTFSIPNVPAGRYLLVAIESDDKDKADLEYRDAAVMKPYVAQAQPVVVPLTTRDTLSIQAIARQAAANSSR